MSTVNGLGAADAALFATRPFVQSPIVGALAKLQPGQRRFVVCPNGIYHEFNAGWVWGALLVAELTDGHDAAGRPTGWLSRFPVGKSLFPQGSFVKSVLPRPSSSPLLGEMKRIAHASGATESVVWMVWDSRINGYALVHPRVTSASGCHVTYDRPSLEPWQHLVVDLHTHGSGPAFYSSADRQDDAGDTKVVIVLGGCDQPSPTSAVTLFCSEGCTIPVGAAGIEIEWEAQP